MAVNEMKIIKLLFTLTIFTICSFKVDAATTIKEVVEVCDNDKPLCSMLLVGFFEGASSASLSLRADSKAKLNYCHENMAKDKHSAKQEMVFWFLTKIKEKTDAKEYDKFLELPFGMFYYTWFLPKKYPLSKDCHVT